MSNMIIARPLLSERVTAAESRTEAFGRENFGNRKRASAVELHLPSQATATQMLLAEILLDLCLRMDPIVCEARVVTSDPAAAQMVAGIAQRFPVELRESPSSELEVIQFAIGPSVLPFVDPGEWCLGFNAQVAGGPGIHPVGAFLGALEAAKHLFLRAVEIAYEGRVDHVEWSSSRVFDAWSWRWCAAGAQQAPTFSSKGRRASIALVGCGGVGAGYLWFLRKTKLTGQLLLVDDDVVRWHNMNRLPFATPADAEAMRLKVQCAADYMASAWAVHPISLQAEHEEAAAALTACARSGGLLASAVGEPGTRKFLGRRGFEHFFDAGTNSDGWARVLSLHPGVSKCSECQVQSRASLQPGGCGQARTASFSGVVPHLAAYAGVLLALEHYRVLLGAR